MRLEGKGFTFDAKPRLMSSPQGEGMIRTPAIEGRRELYVSPVDVKGGTIAPRNAVLAKGQHVESGDVTYTFQGFRTGSHDVMQVVADVEVRRGEMVAHATPMVTATAAGMQSVPATLPGLGELAITRIHAETGSVELALPGTTEPSIAVVDVSRKPLVNLVWIGALVMLLGTSLAGIRRAGEQRATTRAPQAPQAVPAA
jgi:cytochrome c-type biogenesis protein CcmF